MHPSNLILLNIDGLGARYLGPYGNTWIETEGINRLAARGVLFENAFAENAQPGQFLRSFLSQRFAATDSMLADSTPAGCLDTWNTLLVSDHSAVLHGETGDRFELRIEKTGDAPAPRAEHWSDTHLASLFAALIDQTEKLESPFIACLSSNSLATTWDAPGEIAEQFGDEDDPNPYDKTEPPCGYFDTAATDPDFFLAINHAYAAQVIVLDHCVSLLLDHLAANSLLETTAVMFTSSFGLPIGEHGFVGAGHDCLFAEQTQIPLIIMCPENRFHGVRVQSLMQPHQLGAQCFPQRSQLKLETAIEAKAFFPFAFAVSADRQMVRSPSWSLIRHAAETSLFAQPDDRWEINDVSSRCPDVTHGLVELLDAAVPKLGQADPVFVEFAELLTQPAD